MPVSGTLRRMLRGALRPRHRRLPPRRGGRGRAPVRRGGRVLDPVWYLKGVMVAGGLGLAGLSLPQAADLVDAALRPAPPPGSEGCVVLTVVDGDTVTIRCPGRGVERARLTGFDAPELFSPQCAAELARAVAATQALRARIWAAREVALRREGTDRYGRALVALTLDGVPVAGAMIAAGHGRAYAGGRRAGWCD